MNRVEIKELAKQKIKGNKWNIIWPVLLITVVVSILEPVLGLIPKVDFNNMESLVSYKISPVSAIIAFVLLILVSIIMVAYQKYIMNFVRTGNFNSKDIINCVKEKWLNILVSSLLMGIIVGLCSMLLVVPGIIMAMAYAMVSYIVIDTNLNGVDSLKRSREMMKGHKWEYFVFVLSFIGWQLLVPFTFGLLLIWLYPYMTVAECLYYEKLKEISK